MEITLSCAFMMVRTTSFDFIFPPIPPSPFLLPPPSPPSPSYATLSLLPQCTSNSRHGRLRRDHDAAQRHVEGMRVRSSF